MFATIYIYVLLLEFQHMFAKNLCMFLFLNELLRSKVKNGKKVKKHYDHIRTASIKKYSCGDFCGKDDVEMKFAVWRLLFRFSLFTCVSHQWSSPFGLRVSTPRLCAEAPLILTWSTNHISIGEVLWNLETRWKMSGRGSLAPPCTSASKTVGNMCFFSFFFRTTLFKASRCSAWSVL